MEVGIKFSIGDVNMGTYLNPGNGRFLQAVNSKIYIDKSRLISFTNEKINTEQKNICVSRPRRFGKSINLSMLAAYYSITAKGAEVKRYLIVFLLQTIRHISNI